MGKNGVDGVYTADPRKDENAKRFETLSYNRALVDNLAVMDASALSMARDNKKRIRVFGLEEPGNVTRALVGDEIGTLVSTARIARGRVSRKRPQSNQAFIDEQH